MCRLPDEMAEYYAMKTQHNIMICIMLYCKHMNRSPYLFNNKGTGVA